jgi:hypothetical protein
MEVRQLALYRRSPCVQVRVEVSSVAVLVGVLEFVERLVLCVEQGTVLG